MCTGDGGSPLACKHPELPHDSYYLAGIVTGGVKGECGQVNIPGIYENVAEHVVWIREMMRQLGFKEENI